MGCKELARSGKTFVMRSFRTSSRREQYDEPRYPSPSSHHNQRIPALVGVGELQAKSSSLPGCVMFDDREHDL